MIRSSERGNGGGSRRNRVISRKMGDPVVNSKIFVVQDWFVQEARLVGVVGLDVRGQRLAVLRNVSLVGVILIARHIMHSRAQNIYIPSICI